MAIYDNNGTNNYEISKLYDNDGTTNHQIGKVYDNNGTANSLIYTSDTVIVPNLVDYPQSAFKTWTTGSQNHTFTVDANGVYEHSEGTWDEDDDARLCGFAINFATEGHKYLNITYSAGASSSKNHTRLYVGTNVDTGYKYSTLIRMLIEKYEANIATTTTKIDVSAYSNVGIATYFGAARSETTWVKIHSLNLTDD